MTPPLLALLSALSLGLGCAPRLRIPPPVLPPPPTSELPEGARMAYLHAAVIREQGDPVRAQAALARARIYDPDSPWLVLEAARLQLASGSLDEADRTLSSLIPGELEVDALELRAVVARLRAQPVQAELQLIEAMTRDPWREQLWQERVELLVGHEERDGELKILVDRWTEGPALSPAALSTRGQRRLLVGDAAGAVDDLGAAVALGVRGVPLVLLRTAAREAGRSGSALGWLARAAPDEELLRATLSLSRSAGDLWVEQEALLALLALNQQDGRLWAELAEVRRLSGDTRGEKQARARAKRAGVTGPVAVEREAPDPGPRVEAGRALLLAGREEEALETALSAVDLAPASPAAWRLVVDALTAQGRLADAALAEQRAARYAGAGSLRR